MQGGLGYAAATSGVQTLGTQAVLARGPRLRGARNTHPISDITSVDLRWHSPSDDGVFLVELLKNGSPTQMLLGDNYEEALFDVLNGLLPGPDQG